MVPQRRQRLRVVPSRCLSYPVERPVQGTPALRPAPGWLARLPLGQRPSLHGLRRFGLCSTPPRRSSRHLVRSLPRYYGAVRRPAPVRHGRAPSGFAMRAWGRWSRPGAGPPGARPYCFRACQGSATPPGAATPHRSGASAVAFRVCGARRHPGLARFRGSIPCLHVPLSTLHGLRYRSSRMTRGQCGWLDLHCQRLALLHIMPVCPGTPERRASGAPGSRSGATRRLEAVAWTPFIGIPSCFQ
jgi:hypothetical protein